MKVYLASPIDQAGGVAHHGWVVDQLAASDITMFVPAAAFAVGRNAPVDGSIEAINRAALAYCDAVVALLPSGVPTIGTPREIEAAKSLGKPVAVLTDIDRSFSLADCQMWALDAAGLDSAILWLRKRSESKRPALPFHLEDDAVLPARAHPGDAGFDLYAHQSVTIQPGSFSDVPVGARVALPEGVFGRITGRSSTLRKRGLLVAEGIIDTGYRGDLFTGVWNLTKFPVTVERGERIGQLLLHYNVSSEFEATRVDAERFGAIPHDGRGTAGFGSSGA